MNKKIIITRHRWLYIPLFIALVSSSQLYGMQPKPSGGWLSTGWNVFKTALSYVFWDPSPLVAQNAQLLRSLSAPGAFPGAARTLRVVDQGGAEIGQLTERGEAEGAPGTGFVEGNPALPQDPPASQITPAQPLPTADTGPSFWGRTWQGVKNTTSSVASVTGTMVKFPYNVAVAAKNLAEVSQKIKDGGIVDGATVTINEAKDAAAKFRELGNQLSGDTAAGEPPAPHPVPPLEPLEGDAQLNQGGAPQANVIPPAAPVKPPVTVAALLQKMDDSLLKLDATTAAIKGTAEKPAKSWFEGFYEGSIKPFADQYLTKRNMLIAGGVVVGTILTIAIIKTIATRVDRYYNRPRFNFSKIEYKEDWTERDNELLTLQNMVFLPDVKDRLNTVLTTTASLKEQIIKDVPGATFRNLFIYGPPGSGKRLFARQLADHAKMDFYELPGSALSKYKDGEAAAAVDDFFKTVTHQSRKGAVIYINNATLLFGDLSDGTAHTAAVIAAFVEKLEKRSDVYMVVLGSSIKPNAYGDIRTGIDDIIEIKKPTDVERAKGIKLYRDKLLLGGSEVQVTFARSVLDHLSDTKIDQIAHDLDGATIGDIYAYVKTIRDEVQSEGLLSEELVNRVTERAVEKYKALIA